MALKARRSASTRRSSRRKLVWARTIIQDAAVGANSSVFTNLLAAFETEYGADLLGCTVMRVRGFWIPTAGSANDIQVAGIRTFDESSFATLGADDGPGVALHSDWMYWEGQSLENTAGGRVFDVKAMRKIEELNRSLMWAVSNVTAGGQQFNATISVLLALP